MKKIAKWIVILWSVLCLVGVVMGLANVSKEFDKEKSEYAQTGASIGLGCGMGMWVGIWLAIAGPALVIFLVAGNKEKKVEPILLSKESRLCKECGKYYEGNPSFCPQCGKKT